VISVKNLSLRKSKTFGHFFTPRGCEGQIRSSHGNWLREQLMRFIVLDRIRVWKMTLCSVHVVFSSFAEVAVLIVVVFVIMCLVVVLLFFSFCWHHFSLTSVFFCFFLFPMCFSFLFVFVCFCSCYALHFALLCAACWVVLGCSPLSSKESRPANFSTDCETSKNHILQL
jgi:hypothetical protein